MPRVVKWAGYGLGLLILIIILTYAVLFAWDAASGNHNWAPVRRFNAVQEGSLEDNLHDERGYSLRQCQVQLEVERESFEKIAATGPSAELRKMRWYPMTLSCRWRCTGQPYWRRYWCLWSRDETTIGQLPESMPISDAPR